VPARGPRDHRPMPDSRTAPRAVLSCACTLHRRTGGPIEGRTLDVGVGGMRVSTTRPLAQDELLRFDLPLADGPVCASRPGRGWPASRPDPRATRALAVAVP
jgi:hypothetical protein